MQPAGWSTLLDERAVKVLKRAHAATSPPAALSAALSIDSPMTWDDFFHHLFTDTGEDLRGEPVICLRLELLPVLLQRAVVSVMAMQAHRVSGSVLRFCLERARAHFKDSIMMQMLSRVAVPGEACAWSFHHDNSTLGRRLADRLRLSRAQLGHDAVEVFQASRGATDFDAEIVEAFPQAEMSLGAQRDKGCTSSVAPGSEAELVGDKRMRREDDGTKILDTEHDVLIEDRNVIRKSSSDLGFSMKGVGDVEANSSTSAGKAGQGAAHMGALATLQKSSQNRRAEEACAPSNLLSPEDFAKVKALQAKLKALRAHAVEADVPSGLPCVLAMTPLDEVHAHPAFAWLAVELSKDS